MSLVGLSCFGRGVVFGAEEGFDGVNELLDED